MTSFINLITRKFMKLGWKFFHLLFFITKFVEQILYLLIEDNTSDKGWSYDGIEFDVKIYYNFKTKNWQTRPGKDTS